ncbi:MAG: glycine cleavage system protein GcvH [Pseudomonadota bacterium]|nr:glycine cleavage system protein GcvH [Pseudomonadota bacterium]MEC9458970.1 glycine cleavage system protein GcvH [Pseudomonadota bacterium]MEC9481261.1 glycine cleavage system protein GcvH [Pseudomonadota bacterium]
MSDTYFTKDHEWIKIENNTGIVGITKYASEQLGDIVFVELPEKGSQAEKGKDIAVVESVKAASEIYSPVSGIIIDTNENLNDTPEVVNEDPSGDGWFYKIEITNSEEISDLMSEQEYLELIGD